jgi:hypothetical protein
MLTHPPGNGHVAETGPAPGAAPVYSALVVTRLAEEEGRGRSLQARGLAVVTTSGTLVTLIFAVAQFMPSANVTARIPGASRWLLAIAAAAFVGAAVAGLLANLPRDIGRPVSSEIAANISSRWSEPRTAAEKSVALDRARQLQKLENANDITAWAVLAGLAAAVLAIALAAAAVITAIFAG